MFYYVQDAVPTFSMTIYSCGYKIVRKLFFDRAKRSSFKNGFLNDKVPIFGT